MVLSSQGDSMKTVFKTLLLSAGILAITNVSVLAKTPYEKIFEYIKNNKKSLNDMSLDDICLFAGVFKTETFSKFSENKAIKDQLSQIDKIASISQNNEKGDTKRQATRSEIIKLFLMLDVLEDSTLITDYFFPIGTDKDLCKQLIKYVFDNIKGDRLGTVTQLCTKCVDFSKKITSDEKDSAFGQEVFETFYGAYKNYFCRLLETKKEVSNEHFIALVELVLAVSNDGDFTDLAVNAVIKIACKYENNDLVTLLLKTLVKSKKYPLSEYAYKKIAGYAFTNRDLEILKLVFIVSPGKYKKLHDDVTKQLENVIKEEDEAETKNMINEIKSYRKSADLNIKDIFTKKEVKKLKIEANTQDNPGDYNESYFGYLALKFMDKCNIQ